MKKNLIYSTIFLIVQPVLLISQPSKSPPPLAGLLDVENPLLFDVFPVVPQIPALDFSLAILARLGPFCAAVFWIPALALAVFHSDPNASPPADLAAAGFLPAAARDGDDAVALVGEVREEKEEVLPPMPGLPLRVDVGDSTEGWLLKPAFTEV